MLFLGGPPDVSLLAPPPGAPSEIPLMASGPSILTVQRESLLWTYQLQSSARLRSVNVSVWIRVPDPLLAQPDEGILRAWALGVQIGNESYYGGSGPYGPVAPGDYELNTTILLPQELTMRPGDTLSLSVGTSAIAPASQRVLVLAASADYPSRFAFDGLLEPLPP